MTAQLPRNALMLGNFVTGMAVLAPAGMLNELSAGLDVSLLAAGWLVTFGAMILCVGSPLLAWATTHVDRRTLLTATLAIIALGHLASALAPNYVVLLIARLALLAVAAIYTPQAASTIGLIVNEKERAGAIAYIFIGWSLTVAVGLPLVTFLATQFGWRAAYAGIAAIAVVATVLNAVGLPRGLKGMPLSAASWIAVASNRQIVLLLLITVLVISGTFQIFVFLGPLLNILAGASAQVIGLTFAATGVIGLVGNVIVTRVVDSAGPFRVSIAVIGIMVVGLIVWIFGSGVLALMLISNAIVSVGFAASNSIQQARLSAAAPALSSASIALNTSGIYVGQAVGSGIAGMLIAQNNPAAVGYTATAFTVAALIVVFFTRNEHAKVKSL